MLRKMLSIFSAVSFLSLFSRHHRIFIFRPMGVQLVFSATRVFTALCELLPPSLPSTSSPFYTNKRVGCGTEVTGVFISEKPSWLYNAEFYYPSRVTESCVWYSQRKLWLCLIKRNCNLIVLWHKRVYMGSGPINNWKLRGQSPSTVGVVYDRRRFELRNTAGYSKNVPLLKTNYSCDCICPDQPPLTSSANY